MSINQNLSGDVGSGEKTPLQSEYVNSMSTYDPPRLAYHTAVMFLYLRIKIMLYPFLLRVDVQSVMHQQNRSIFQVTTIPTQPVIASPANVNVDLIAAKVYEIIQRKIKMQREERGLR